MNSAMGVSTLSSYAYTLGAAGNRTAVTELSGRTVNYTYDDLYRLTNETIANDTYGINGTVHYGYDPVGNRLSRASSVAGVPSQTSTYDANDRLTADTYNANGNTTTSTGGTYDYDFENRLITHTASITSGFVYDGDGNRVAKTVGGVTTNYLVDTNNHTGYAQVVEELQGGAVVKQFSYGHDLISQRIVGSSLSFYGYDGHGSVRLLTDATASVTDTYDYDAFGNLIYRSGTTPNDYLYSGEQFDANLGFYYLRARYMNGSSGRFWTIDSFEGTDSVPLSLHKYLYAHADPVNNIDPSGYTSLQELNQTFATFSPILSQGALQLLGVKASLATAAVGGGLTLSQAIGATAAGISIALAIGSIALKKFKERADKDGYEFITVYRWTTTLAASEFTIGPKDNDGYLSVWKDLASTRPKSYNVPMLAMFKKPRQPFDEGWLVTPDIREIKVMHNPIFDDPNGDSHYSFAYFGIANPYGKGYQGNIPGRLADYADGLGLQPGEFRDPFAGLK